MTKFVYSNTKNVSTSQTSFKLNYNYHFYIFLGDKTNPCSKSYFANKLAKKLKNLILICWQNLFYAQKLKKQVYDKGLKPWSYASDKKVLLNKKYMKIKQNWKLKTKFFGYFQVLYLLDNQAYKLKLSIKWIIHDIFYM